MTHILLRVFPALLLVGCCCEVTFAAEVYDRLSLDQAVQIALDNNIEKKVSYQSIAIAEAQYQEALSAQWPSLALQAGFDHRSQPPMFLFPSKDIPLDNLGTALGAALGPMLPPGATIPQSLKVPEQAVKLMNSDTGMVRLQMTYPIYTGGKISSLISQADFGRDIAQQEFRRTSLQVVRDVKRYYYAAQLTQRLTETANDTVSLLSSTRDLTKKLYEAGSSSLNKLDYLKTEMAVAYAKSIAADFAARHKSALTQTMGLEWNSEVRPSDSLKVSLSNQPALDALVRQATEFNPQIGTLRLAVKIADAKIDEARSGYFPQIALTANATHYENSYNAGLNTEANRNNWTIGIGVSMPLFDGWRTSSQVDKAKLEYAQTQERQKMVEQGISALVKNLFIEFDSARQQVAISEEAKHTAEENADLTSRAFEIGASKPDDVVQAQILLAIIQGNLFRAYHDQLLKLAELDFVLGMESQ
jgi:outer membrane protein TolC